jgi:hypothetical protein
MEPVGSAPAAHCDLTGHVDFLIDWILQGAQLTGPSIGDAMGFEHWGHLHPHRKMMAGALLGNGSHWTIGTPSGNGGWGTDWPHFEVRLAPCTAPLVIGSGGALSVGEPSGQGTGTLRVTRGNTLELRSAGTLHIGKGSQLIVEAGASLKIEGSGLLLEAGSLLTVLPGGSLVFTGTSEVQLQAPSLFSLLGTMTAAPAATITVSALDGAEVHLAGECTLSSGSEWRLQGSSALAFPLFVDSSWACSGAGGVRWEHLICTLGVDVNVDLGATQRWDDVEIWPESSSYVNSTARWRWEGGSANRLIVHHNHMASADPFWVDVTLDESHITTEFSSPKILDCEFNQSKWHALFAEDSEWSGCVFNGNGSERACI